MTKIDLIIHANRLAGAIYKFLEEKGVQQTADGLHCTALTGDEDQETVLRYRRVFQPLSKLEQQLRGLSALGEPLDIDPEYDDELEAYPSQESLRYEFLALPDDASDAEVLRVFRLSRGLTER